MFLRKATVHHATLSVILLLITGSEIQAETLSQVQAQTNANERQPVRDLSFNGLLSNNIQRLRESFPSIAEERRKKLDRLAGVISAQRSAGQTVKLVFICTHNSRRSHMGQIWAAAAAAFFGVTRVSTYSGGTEVSSFHPNAVAALQRVGFRIEAPAAPWSSLQPFPQTAHKNIRYRVSFSRDRPTMTAFSKKYDAPSNPQKGFVAIMTCDHANDACPAITGASFRIALPWVDPKAADNTPQEASRYDERVRQIGSEMLYVFARVSG